MEYLSLGTIIDSFGIKGQLKVYSTTTQASKRYKKGSIVFLCDKFNNRQEFEVESYRSSKGFDFVKLKNIDTPEEAIKYKGFEIHIIKDKNDLEVGYYYFDDLLNCSLYDQDDKYIGKIIRIEEFPAQITLRAIRENGKQFFVPFVKQFIKNVDIDNKKISINVIEGMLWK